MDIDAIRFIASSKGCPESAMMYNILHNWVWICGLELFKTEVSIKRDVSYGDILEYETVDGRWTVIGFDFNMETEIAIIKLRERTVEAKSGSFYYERGIITHLPE